MKTVIPVLSVLALLIVLTIILVVFSRKKSVRAATIKRTLAMILCCNSYDKMGDVYTVLDQNTAKYGVKIQYNYRGYFR